MELIAIALLIVAAILLIWGQLLKSRRLNRQRQLNGYQPVKSTYQPTFEDPAATAGPSQGATAAPGSTTPETATPETAAPETAAPGSVEEQAREAAERMARDLSALLQSKTAGSVSYETTVTTTTSAPAQWATTTSHPDFTAPPPSGTTYTERSISLTEETASRVKALALAGKRGEALEMLGAETGMDGKGAFMMLEMIVEQY